MVDLCERVGRLIVKLQGAELAALGVGAVVVGVIAYRTVKGGAAAVGGLVTGNNAITENQTNAAGEPTTAYVGAGIPGTVGAVFNGASGGTFATWGENLGSWFYDLTNSDPLTAGATTAATSAPAPAAQDQYDALGNYLGHY